MKKIIKSIDTEIYVCEECGSESQNPYTIKQCEKNHVNKKAQANCKHAFKYYMDKDYEASSFEIVRHCPECNSRKNVTIDEDDFTTEELKAIFERLLIKREGCDV